MNIKSKPKVWAPYHKHKTYLMYKDNIWERLQADDVESVITITDKLRELLGNSTDSIVKCWIDEYRLVHGLLNNRVVEHATWLSGN